MFLLKAFEEKCVSLLFPPSGGCLYSQAYGPFLKSLSSLLPSFVSLSTATLLPLSFTYWNLSDDIGPAKIIQDNLSFLRSASQSPFSHVKLHIPRLWRLGRGHLWGTIILSTHCEPNFPFRNVRISCITLRDGLFTEVTLKG